MGDFNELLDSNDKFGGRPLLSSRVQAFHSCLTTCGLLELATSGPKCTWANKHWDWRCHIRERLDRAFHNAAWQLLFPKAHCLTLPRFHSDHHPIIASTEDWETAAPQKHFFFSSQCGKLTYFFVILLYRVGQTMKVMCFGLLISLMIFTKKYNTFRPT